MNMATTKKPQYIRVHIRVEAEAYKSFFEQYQHTLNDMGLSFPKLVQWCANEGRPIVEKTLKEWEHEQRNI